MQQTQFEKLVAVAFAEFDRRVREARARAAWREEIAASDKEAPKRELRIEELVA